MLALSTMETEALETPAVLEKQFVENQSVLKKIIAKIREVNPTTAITIARGSSDHAATFAKYLLETRAGMITSSAAPSIYTLYEKKLPVKNCLVIGISQSGASPDIVNMMTSMREAGAITVAFVNEQHSPLANAAEFVVPLWAGQEKAVAATKSYIASLSALIHFVAMLSGDNELMQVLSRLPESLRHATEVNWSSAIEQYQNVQNTFVIGRSFSFPIAQEAALKFKETAKIHAEALSSAELLHGPFGLVDSHFPLLVFAQQDQAFSGIIDVVQRSLKLHARVMIATPMLDKLNLPEGLIQLPMPKSLHPVCDPLLIIQAFYIMMARLSLARGLNPDAPLNLTKVTKTW